MSRKNTDNITFIDLEDDAETIFILGKGRDDV
jgi:hypothetical protein